MSIAVVYDIVLISIGLVALWRGGSVEKTGALIITAASWISVFASPGRNPLFSSLNPGLVAIDGLAFLAFAVLACRGGAFWPLWAAAMQLLTFAANFVPMSAGYTHPFAYALNEQLWAWPILALILVMSIWGPRLHDWATTTRSP